MDLQRQVAAGQLVPTLGICHGCWSVSIWTVRWSTAGKLGFKAFVVADATFAFDKADFKGVRRAPAMPMNRVQFQPGMAMTEFFQHGGGRRSAVRGGADRAPKWVTRSFHGWHGPHFHADTAPGLRPPCRLTHRTIWCKSGSCAA